MFSEPFQTFHFTYAFVMCYSSIVFKLYFRKLSLTAGSVFFHNNEMFSQDTLISKHIYPVSQVGLSELVSQFSFSKKWPDGFSANLKGWILALWKNERVPLTLLFYQNGTITSSGYPGLRFRCASRTLKQLVLLSYESYFQHGNDWMKTKK